MWTRCGGRRWPPGCWPIPAARQPSGRWVAPGGHAWLSGRRPAAGRHRSTNGGLRPHRLGRIGRGAARRRRRYAGRRGGGGPSRPGAHPAGAEPRPARGRAAIAATPGRAPSGRCRGGGGVVRGRSAALDAAPRLLRCAGGGWRHDAARRGRRRRSVGSASGRVGPARPRRRRGVSSSRSARGGRLASALNAARFQRHRAGGLRGGLTCSGISTGTVDSAFDGFGARPRIGCGGGGLFASWHRPSRFLHQPRRGGVGRLVLAGFGRLFARAPVSCSAAFTSAPSAKFPSRQWMLRWLASAIDKLPPDHFFDGARGRSSPRCRGHASDSAIFPGWWSPSRFRDSENPNCCQTSFLAICIHLYRRRSVLRHAGVCQSRLCVCAFRCRLPCSTAMCFGQRLYGRQMRGSPTTARRWPRPRLLGSGQPRAVPDSSDAKYGPA